MEDDICGLDGDLLDVESDDGYRVYRDRGVLRIRFARHKLMVGWGGVSDAIGSQLHARIDGT